MCAGSDGVHARQDIRWHPQLAQLDGTPARAPTSASYALPMNRGHRGDAQIEIPHAKPHAATAVLWAQALGDVQFRGVTSGFGR